MRDNLTYEDFKIKHRLLYIVAFAKTNSERFKIRLYPNGKIITYIKDGLFNYSHYSEYGEENWRPFSKTGMKQHLIKFYIKENNNAK